MRKFLHDVEPENFNPTVEVAVCFCQVGDNILLLQRNDDKILGGTWVIPGGKMDDDQDAKDCVVREVAEETGIGLPKNNVLFVRKMFVRGRKLEEFKNSINIDFVLHIFKVILPILPDAITLNPDEHQNFAWVTPEKALEMRLLPGQDEYIHLVYD